MHKDNWQQYLTHTIEPFWSQHVLEWIYQPKPNFNIHYALADQADASSLIILIPGRVETYLKYKELVYDLYQKGYAVLTLDHRGQGQSSRELSTNEKGHIDNFEDYADDLNAVCEEIRAYQKYQTVNILAHSMGCAIGLDYLYRYQPPINSAVLSAPMLGINAGPLSQKQAKFVVSLVKNFSVNQSESPYFIGQKPYERYNFELNPFCSNQARFEHNQNILSQDEIKLGGVTVDWLNQALKKTIWLKEHVEKLPCRCLLLQAQLDVIVSNKAQKAWFKAAQQANKDVTFKKIKKAKHEILMESDKLRNAVLQQIFEFFEAD